MATRFLHFLTDGAPEGTFFAVSEYRTTPDGERKNRNWFHPSKDIESEAEMAINMCDANKSDMFIRVSLLKERPETGRGKKEHTAGTSVLWVDIDIKDGKTYSEIWDKIADFKLPPSWVNASGKGFHAYWKLNKFQTDILAIERRTRWLAKHLGGDYCWDVSRVLRIPGTRNWKNPREEAYVLPEKKLCHPDRVYRMDEFGEDELTADEIGMDIDFVEEPLPDDFLTKIPKHLADRIVDGKGAPTKQNGQINRSVNDWFIVMSLLESTFTPGQCTTVLLHPEWFCGQKSREVGFGYASYTVARALVHHRKKQGAKVEPVLAKVIHDLLYYIDGKGKKARRKLDKGTDLVGPCVSYLIGAGYKFYSDIDSPGIGYLVTPTGLMVTVDEESVQYRDFIYNITGYTSAEVEHRMIRSGIAAYTRTYGDPARPAAWCKYDRYTNTFYVLNDPRGKTMLKVPSKGFPKVVTNGTDRTLLQPSTNTSLPFEYNEEVDLAQTLPMFKDMFTKWIAANPYTRGLLTCYMLAIPLTSGMPIQTLPLLHLTGPSGHGKSQTLMMITSWLYGEPALTNLTTAASYRISSREALLAFDDYEKLTDDVKQFILTATTGVTRQKSGKGVMDTVSQNAHVLMALTSINVLEGEAVRRRTLMAQIDKALHPTPGYSEFQWQDLQKNRSSLWSAYCLWLAEEVLPYLDKVNFSSIAREVEQLIPIDTFKGLSSFLAFMYIIGEKYEEYTPGFFGVDRPTLQKIIPAWIDQLKLGDLESSQEQDYLLIGLQNVFESVRRGAEAELFQLNHVVDEDTYVGSVKIINTVMRDKSFRLHGVPAKKMPESSEDTVWFGLEGTTTEWLSTLVAASYRQFPSMSAHALGWAFERVTRNQTIIEVGARESEPVHVGGFYFVKLKNAGPNFSHRGWRVMIEVNRPLNDDEEEDRYGSAVGN